MLREYFFEHAVELDRLRGQLRAEGHTPDVEVRIGDLERLFSGDQAELQSLDAGESEENWFIPRRTGDPLADKWERQLAAGETPDLEV